MKGINKTELSAQDIVRSLTLCADAGKCHETHCAGCGFKGDPNCASNMMIRAAQMISAQLVDIADKSKRIAELEERLRWTPVTEQSLPDEFVSVLVNIPSDDPLPTVKEAYLVDDVWVTKTSHYTKHEITHWRTMPKGPEVRSE